MNATVSKSEADALKEMIFNRVRERAKVLAEEVQSSYTDAVQTDIMDMARNSFQINNNPFAKTETSRVNESSSVASNKEIGFTQNNNSDDINAIKTKIKHGQQTIQSNITAQEISSNMYNAHNDFSDRKTFVGALDFLNRKASIVLINKNGKNSFDTMA